MSDEYGDYAGDEQHTIRLMMQTCFNCDDEWTEKCADKEHEPLLSSATSNGRCAAPVTARASRACTSAASHRSSCGRTPSSLEEYLSGGCGPALPGVRGTDDGAGDP